MEFYSITGGSIVTMVYKLTKGEWLVKKTESSSVLISFLTNNIWLVHRCESKVTTQG